MSHFTKTSVAFQSKTILTKAMLEAVRDHSYVWQAMYYQAYGDGIVQGCEIVFDDVKATLRLKAGIVKYDGEIYTLQTDHLFTDLIEDKNYIVQLKKSAVVPEQQTINLQVDQLMIEVVGKSELDPTAMQLARFIYRPMEMINYHQQNVSGSNDFALSLTSGASQYDSHMLSPQLRAICRMNLLQKAELDSYDFTLLMQLEHPSGCSRMALVRYIQAKIAWVDCQVMSNDFAVALEQAMKTTVVQAKIQQVEKKEDAARETQLKRQESLILEI